MDFKTYWFGMSLEDRAAFANRVDRAQGYLQLVAGGFRRASPELAIAIDEKSDGKVKRAEMRPDIFDVPPPPEQGRAAA